MHPALNGQVRGTFSNTSPQRGVCEVWSGSLQSLPVLFSIIACLCGRNAYLTIEPCATQEIYDVARTRQRTSNTDHFFLTRVVVY